MRWLNYCAQAAVCLLFLSGCGAAYETSFRSKEVSVAEMVSAVAAEEADSGGTEADGYMDFFQSEVHEIRIELEEESWQAMLADPESEIYYQADIHLDGAAVTHAGIRIRGSSSLRMAKRRNSIRYPFRIKFDEFVEDQTFMGLDELVLNNSTDDPSFVREYMGYEALKHTGLPTPGVTFSNVYINEELLGLYVTVEAIDNSYLDRVYGHHEGNLYKAELGATLEPDMEPAAMEQKKGDDESRRDLGQLTGILDEMESGEKGEIESILDVESVLQYFAGNAVIHNWDDYAGQFAHNYYLYMSDGRFHMIPWDMNEAFLQTQAYYRESDGARQDISSPITGDVAAGTRPLAEKLLAVPEYYEKYLEYCRRLETWLTEAAEEQIPELERLITEAAVQDPTKFFTDAETELEFQTDYSEGIMGFMGERAEYLREWFLISD